MILQIDILKLKDDITNRPTGGKGLYYKIDTLKKKDDITKRHTEGKG